MITDCRYNRKVVQVSSLTSIPYRRTFDRRLKTLSTDIKERISTIGNLFVAESIVDLYLTAIDSNLLKVNGRVWHKSSMEKGVLPCPSIDTDAR